MNVRAFRNQQLILLILSLLLLGCGKQYANVERADKYILSTVADSLLRISEEFNETPNGLELASSDLGYLYTMLESSWKYTNDSSREYSLSNTSSKIKTLILQSKQLDSTLEINKNLPSLEKGEYDRANIKKENGRLVFLLERKKIFNEEISPVVENYELDAELVEGRWDDFESGKTIQFRLTQRGIEEYKKTMETSRQEYLQKLIRLGVRKLIDSLQIEFKVSNKQSDDDFESHVKTPSICKYELLETERPIIFANKRAIWTEQPFVRTGLILMRYKVILII